MPFPIIPAVSAGLSIYQALKGGKQKQGYEMSPQEQMLIQQLMDEMKSTNVPGAVTAPFFSAAKDIKSKYAEQPGSSGLETANLQKFAYAPMAEASGNYLENKKQRLTALLASITRGTGTSWAQGAPDFGPAGEDIGAMLWEIMNKKKGVGGESPGGGFQYGWGGF